MRHRRASTLALSSPLGACESGRRWRHLCYPVRCHWLAAAAQSRRYFRPPRYHTPPEAGHLVDDHLVIAAGTKSRFANRRKIDLAELVNEPWILAATDTWNYRNISEAFRSRGLEMPRIVLRTLSTQLRTNMLASGKFIATFPHSVVEFYAERFALKVLPVALPMVPWPVAILTLKNRTLSPVAELFISHLRQSVAATIAPQKGRERRRPLA
jgi:DNA-binding transcriptional LysR family regulator